MISSINVGGKLMSFEEAKIMGILNQTPDSFYTRGANNGVDGALFLAEKMIAEGADILDVGGQSTRPGAERIGIAEELKRVVPSIEAIMKRFPEAIVSIDTFNAGVARAAVEAGALIVNDISAGMLDKEMLQTVSELKVSYIMMHMQGEPTNMQLAPEYEDVVVDVFEFLKRRLFEAQSLGIKDLILDLGFGFGKTVAHNFSLLKNLKLFEVLEKPILVGVSRKSMINRALNIKAADALNGTTALHMAALERGANILRVHDVKEAREVVSLYEQLKVAN